MKTKITVLLATVLVASTSFAQNTLTAKMPTNDGISSKGFRIGVVKPMLEADYKLSYQGQHLEIEENLEALGFSLGYASLPVQELGWTTNATYMDIKSEGGSVGLARIDGNLAYAFTSIINVKGGLNVSKFTSREISKYDAGIGFQGGVGVQITKNFGLDLGYTQMNQSDSVNGVKVNLKESGVEIGLNGTF
ncbi:MAG: hypothetical protein K1X29_04510 [Bdellovibrionales bacterium]|nr:hypothetical protein [Bdellovibrionales bacterium]